MANQFVVFWACVLSLLALVEAGETHAEWSYRGPTGPPYWANLFPQYCAGSSQSPINISPTLTTPSSAGPVELYGYQRHDIPKPSQMDFTNNGHTVQVTLTGDFYIRGGPLKATYQAAQFHFHWGSTKTQGSEHTISGQQYPAEMHIVHWDRDNYKSIDEALMHKNGLAVLGVLIQAGNTANPTFDNLVNVIDKVTFKGDTYTLPEVFAISGLLPPADDLNEYFHYEGSLTTPHCNEAVQWIVYEKPIKISWQQLDLLRSVYENTAAEGKITPLVDNFRPTQPLNGRSVFAAK